MSEFIRIFVRDSVTSVNEVNTAERLEPFIYYPVYTYVLPDTVISISNDLPVIKEALNIIRIDPLIHENGTNHHTMRYEHMQSNDNSSLIIRRGQPFKLELYMDRDFLPEKDGVSFVFQLTGVQRPGIGAGTEVIVPVSEHGFSEEANVNWHASVFSHRERKMVVKVNASANCIVGEWKMQVDTKLKTSREGLSYSFLGTVIILFNAWSPYDQVYMEDEGLRQEYVLRDFSYFFRGAYTSFGSALWIYGQYQKDVVNCVLYIISSMKPLAYAVRHNALYIVRHFTKILHTANDGTGVLVGNWNTSTMGDGRHPSSWLGSHEILKQFYATKRPVKYGQCCTFAGLCTTVCRVLGIPSRSITTFSSANQTGDFRVSIYLDESGHQRHINGQLWNYHMWLEIWVKRPDLSTSGSHDGWCAVDATPQSLSEGAYQCGPTSVRAVKYGEVLKYFDTTHVYGEVNSDVWYYLLSRDGFSAKLLNVNTNLVGKLTVTQAVGSNYSNAINLTDTYKFPEGSIEERRIYEAAARAVQYSRRSIFRYKTNSPTEWIKCELVMPKSPELGSVLQVNLKIRNLSEVTLAVKVFITLSIQSYTGKELRRIKTEEHNTELKSQEEYVQSVEASYGEYRKLVLSVDDVLHATYLASVPDKDYDIAEVDIAAIGTTSLKMMLTTPDTRPNAVPGKTEDLPVDLVTHDDASHFQKECRTATHQIELFGTKGSQEVKNEKITMSTTFKNPLPIKLTGGVFKFATPLSDMEVKLDRDVEPYETFTQTTEWEIPRTGESSFVMVAEFSSNEVKSIRGSFHRQLEEASLLN